MTKAIKEIIIMLLICLITMLIFAIALYKYVPNRKIIPEVVAYVATEEIQDLLNDNIDTKSEEDNVILTYEVTSSDLKNYQSTNIYVPGKSNPFAAVDTSTTVEGEFNSNESKEKIENDAEQNNENTTPSVYQNSGTK